MDTEPQRCHICGRTGIHGFKVVERYADGSQTMRCMNGRACNTRAVKADRLRAKATERR